MSTTRLLALAGASAVVLAAVLLVTLQPAPSAGRDGDDGPPRWWKPPSDVRDMLRKVDDDSLERIDRALVGFGTRHTLSTQDDPNRGIGAARDWIKSEFDKAAATSGGRMTVELQSYIQEPASRIPVPTRITNVMATLRGTDPASADRVYVVGAHYDSRVSDVLNATSDAPGANDDGSGTAAVIELARVFAPRPTESTIVFVAFAGEEQGLYGSEPLRPARAGQRVEHRGRAEHGHHRQPCGRERLPRAAQIRLLNEGVPTAETPQQTARRRSLGGENDGVSRQLARYVEETGENGSTGMDVKLVYRRDRFGRGGDQISFLERGWSAVRFSEPNEFFEHQHQDVRVEGGVQFGDLLEFVDFNYLAAGDAGGRFLARRARALAARARQREYPDGALVRRAGELGRRARTPTWSATRWCGATPSSSAGRTAAESATSPPRRSRT